MTILIFGVQLFDIYLVSVVLAISIEFLL